MGTVTDKTPAAPTRGPNYRKDPSERRTGDAPLDEMAAVLTRALDDAAALVHKDNVDRKKALTMKEMVESIDTVRGAVMILYPMGLPEWDMVRANLENTEELDGTQAGSDLLDPDNSTMWWANKELQ